MTHNIHKFMLFVFCILLLNACPKQNEKINDQGIKISEFPTPSWKSTDSRKESPDFSLTPYSEIEKKEITLYSNVDPNEGKDFPINGLINPENSQAFYDFDDGEINNSTNADIYLFVGCGSDCFNSIKNINNAKSVYIGRDEPGFQRCEKELNGKTEKTTSSFPGNYSCLKTNDDNIVEILVINSSSYSYNAKIVIDYIIWFRRK